MLNKAFCLWTTKCPEKKEMLLEYLISCDLKKLKQIQGEPRLIFQFPESQGGTVSMARRGDDFGSRVEIKDLGK